MDPCSPLINAYPINNTVSLSIPSLISINQLYVNIPIVILSNCTNYYYFYNDTFLPSFVHFVFPSSDQIASDIIHFNVQASPHTSPNNLQLVVLENMLNKHFKQILISHIDLLLLAFPNRDDTSFESIIRSCIVHFWL